VLENNKKLKVMDLHKNDIQNITGTLTESQKGRNGEFANVNLLDLRDNKKIGDIAKLFHRIGTNLRAQTHTN
jgi:translation elongation factor P/translation initiation factor 5A